jgi:hypothetical protein
MKLKNFYEYVIDTLVEDDEHLHAQLLVALEHYEIDGDASLLRDNVELAVEALRRRIQDGR